ncbi:MAG: hypothetical protein WAU58_19750, partial [Terriglobales bacterium]
MYRKTFEAGGFQHPQFDGVRHLTPINASGALVRLVVPEEEAAPDAPAAEPVAPTEPSELQERART